MDSSPYLKCPGAKCVASVSRNKSTLNASQHTALIASFWLGIPSTWKGPTVLPSPFLKDASKRKEHPCTHVCLSHRVSRSDSNGPHTEPPGCLCVWEFKTPLTWWVRTSCKMVSISDAGVVSTASLRTGISPPEAGRLPCNGKAAASSNNAAAGSGGWPCHDEEEVISNTCCQGDPGPGLSLQHKQNHIIAQGVGQQQQQELEQQQEL